MLWLRQVHRRFFGIPYKQLVTIRLYREKLIANYRALCSIAGVPVLPVLKSNAYGHGLLPIARILDPLSPPYFVVDSYYEMMQLKKGDIQTPILIVGHTFPENITANFFRGVVFTILSVAELQILVARVTTPITIHLKIDTGLYRHGVLSHEFLSVAELLQQNAFITLRGLCTHYRDADCDDVFTRVQTERFQEAVLFFSSRFVTCTEFQAKNSAGIVEKFFHGHTFVRSGIALYGFGNDAVSPIMSIHTCVVSIKKIPAGASVGYGGTFIAPQELTIATIPFGYYEGLDRRLSNKGCVVIKGVMCPIVGRISMNITTVDVSAIPDIALHDPVEIVGSDITSPHSFAAHARISEDIVYTHVVHILEHAHRDIV